MSQVYITIGRKLLYRPECFIMCGVLQTADSKELFIILPQTSHRFQSNEAPFFKVNIRIFEHKVKPFCEWIQCLGFIWHLLVMYSPCWNGIFTKEGVLSLQNCHNWRESANHPGKKITKCHLEFSYFFICTATSIILHFMELVNFSHKYSIWTRRVCHQKVPNEPQTLDPFTEWLNFIFKYTNIYFKK